MGSHSRLHLVNPGVLNEIYGQRRILNNLNDQFEVAPSTELASALQTGAAHHSAEIELVGCAKNEINRERRKYKRNIDKALEWGIESYDGSLDVDFIFGLAKRIEPRTRGIYRTSSAHTRTSKGVMYYPSPEELTDKMQYFLFENCCINDEVEKAIHAHYNISKIHPLFDGNGRLARIVQNIMLNHDRLLPSVIKQADRKEYMGLIADASYSERFLSAEVEVESNPLYTELDSIKSSEAINLGDIPRCVFLGKELLKQRTGKEINTFFNYIALNISSLYGFEIERLERKISKRNGNKKTSRKKRKMKKK